jgi:hypothetical protein
MPHPTKQKLKTENKIPNRKIRFMAYAGAITTIGFIILNRVLSFDVPEQAISEFVTSAILVVTAIMSLVGYFTDPESGDGTTAK